MKILKDKAIIAWRHILTRWNRFVYRNQKLKINVYLHFIGNGNWDKIKGRIIEAETPDFDLNLFAIRFPKSLKYREDEYRYEDCLRESFVRNGKQVIVVHVRYLLDLEKANFKEFLEKVSPADFVKSQ